MKNRIISLLIIYGVLFLIVLFIFIPTKLDICINPIFGWILIACMVGVVFFLIISQINPNKIDGKLISSKSTPIFKFIFPLTSFLAAILFGSLYMFQLITFFDLTGIIVVVTGLISLFLLAFFPWEPMASLCRLYMCEDMLVISDFFQLTEVKFSEVVNLKYSIYKTYRIEVLIENKLKSFYFKPTILVVILPFYTPPSIKKIHEIIERNK